MFIAWGKKTVHRKLGHVADFCPICRCPRDFSLRRVGLAGHVYYVSLSEGELVGHDRTCADCGTRYNANPDDYASIAKKSAPTDALIAATFPKLKEAWAKRLAVEVDVRTAASLMPADQRAWLIRKPFVHLSPQVEAQYAATHFDKEVGFAALGALALTMLLPSLVRSVSPDDGEPAILTAMVVGLMLIVWQLTQVSRRFLRRKILPNLARALKPLRPTDAELGVALDELKAQGHKIGKKLKAADVSAQLHAPAAAGAGRLAGEG